MRSNKVKVKIRPAWLANNIYGYKIQIRYIKWNPYLLYDYRFRLDTSVPALQRKLIFKWKDIQISLSAIY